MLVKNLPKISARMWKTNLFIYLFVCFIETPINIINPTKRKESAYIVAYLYLLAKS